MQEKWNSLACQAWSALFSRDTTIRCLLVMSEAHGKLPRGLLVASPANRADLRNRGARSEKRSRLTCSPWADACGNAARYAPGIGLHHRYAGEPRRLPVSFPGRAARATCQGAPAGNRG